MKEEITTNPTSTALGEAIDELLWNADERHPSTLWPLLWNKQPITDTARRWLRGDLAGPEPRGGPWLGRNSGGTHRRWEYPWMHPGQHVNRIAAIARFKRDILFAN